MDKTSLFSIGEVAKLFNISVETLRHYEKINLLSPEYKDPQSGYRYYSTRQFEILNTIRYLRALDTPLEKISEFLNDRNLDSIKKLLEQQRLEIAEKRRQLETVEKKIDNRLAQLNDALSSQLDKVEIRNIPSRKTVTLKDSLNLKTYLDLEIPIRRLEGKQKEAVVFLGKVGVGIKRENLEKGINNTYDKVFLILDPEDSFVGNTAVLPKCTCACLRYKGSHKEAPEQYERLLEFIKRENLNICGDSCEITMIDNGYTRDTQKFVTEIQIPIA